MRHLSYSALIIVFLLQGFLAFLVVQVLRWDVAAFLLLVVLLIISITFLEICFWLEENEPSYHSWYLIFVVVGVGMLLVIGPFLLQFSQKLRSFMVKIPKKKEMLWH